MLVSVLCVCTHVYIPIAYVYSKLRRYCALPSLFDILQVCFVYAVRRVCKKSFLNRATNFLFRS